MAKVFPIDPVPIEKENGESNRIIRKIFDTERKELTDLFSPVNIL